MSKAPAFQFYAAEYLADEAVNLMSLEAEGAYTRLLAYCWREGSIPANEKQLSRLCKGAAAEVIEEVIDCFYADPTQPGRLLHKRLESERAKQEEYRARQAAKGQKGGRPKKPDESPEKPPAFAGLSITKADEKPAESSSSSTSSSTSTDVDEREPEPAASGAPQALEAKPMRKNYAPPADDAVLFTADTWPGLVNPATFASICTDLRLPIDLDRETYRAAIQDKMRSQGIEAPPKSLRSWISAFFINEKKRGPLLSLTVGLPTKPTPKNELPAPGQEYKGQIIVIEGVPNDDNLNRMKVATYQGYYPTATIHALR